MNAYNTEVFLGNKCSTMVTQWQLALHPFPEFHVHSLKLKSDNCYIVLIVLNCVHFTVFILILLVYKCTKK